MRSTRARIHINAPRADVYRALIDADSVAKWMVPDADNPAMLGAMTITMTLADANGGTDLSAVHENLPPALSGEQNALGRRLSLAKLAALVGI